MGGEVKAPARRGSPYEAPLVIVLLGCFLGFLAASAAPGVPPETRQAFFGIAIQVNAAFLLAVFVMASFLLPRLTDPERKGRYALNLTVDAGIFFLSMMSSTWGFFVGDVTAHPLNLTLVVILSWVVGLALLTDGIRQSARVPP